MEIRKDILQEQNNKQIQDLEDDFTRLAEKLTKKGVNIQGLLQRLQDFQVAIPSWALGAGGTRFGRFGFFGEPTSLEEKIDDIGILHALTKTAGAVSLHIPWDIPNDYAAIKEKAKGHGIIFDAVNSNTFQDQSHAQLSYRHGSLSSMDKEVRQMAVQHNNDVVDIGEKLGSKSLTVWLADGTNFPGQRDFQSSLLNTQDSLKKIYGHMPDDWKLFIEYKPYEPNFYSTVIQDWGTSFMLANACGERAYTLVDLGHHLPNTNIEQIVATLMLKGKLGGFHFNDSKYGDDDLTVGSIKPYSLFLIFNELVNGMERNKQNPELAWMIDASHNIKDPLEDLLQSLEAIQESYAKAMLINQESLLEAQSKGDVVQCQEILQDAFRTDVRPLLAKARVDLGGAVNPLKIYRAMEVRNKLIAERGKHTVATGL
ncbi:sugar isomerase [Maribacter sp. MAR_2009_72]|uniref:sugar isomerase n=1 Tax=Maribacter sp. MAR_2009_72 TaxID=1250050 RepID=UPI001199A0E9|nr:sugar isomerase [Maribacter sp. MAR_2009_72]TVZ14901.1 L-rhamnose isomerase/sugar isomerase [Maribacter sp. MAR_2009_72]